MRRLALLFLVVGCGSDPTEQPPPDPDCDVEQCNGVDDNCDGVVDEGCDCVDGDERRCEGSDVGACFAGVSRCAGGEWLACEGQIEPVAEECNGIDDDCDGVADGAPADATCGAVAHGTAACVGQCTTVCSAGFDDCNGDFADGCEADLGTSATCGACNVQCATGDFCEQGSCTSVPALLWSAPFGPNQPYAIDLDATGAMTIGSEIETSLVLDSQTIETTSGSPTILTARVAATGALDWARVDGPSFRGNFTSSHDGITYLLAAGTGEIDSTSVGPRFAVAFDDDGAALWARTVDLGTGSLRLSVAGPAGVDLTGSNVIHRLDSDGNEVSLRPIPAGDFVYAQLPDGSNLIGGSTSSPLAADCSLLATQAPAHHIARLDADGTCTLILSYELASSSSIAVAPQLGGGFLLVGRGPGTMSIGSSTVAVPERFTMSVDASFDVRWVAPFGGTLETDARGNVYLFELSNPPGSGSIRSLRPDGVERWTIALDNAAGVFPGTNFNVSPAGHIGLSISTLELGPLVIGDVELPHSPITVLALEAK